MDQAALIISDLIGNEPSPNPAIVDTLESTPQSTDETPSEPRAEVKDAPAAVPVTIPFPVDGIATEPHSETKDAPASPPGAGSNDAFDPAIHETDEWGNPRKTASGKYRRKRGRKNRSGGSPDSVPNTQPGARIDFAATGKMLAGVLFGACQSMFDAEEWEPTDNERAMIEGASINWCQSNAWGDIPPGIALVLVVTTYALPRLTRPITRGKVAGLGASLGIGKRKKRVENTAAGSNPPSAPFAGSSGHPNPQPPSSVQPAAPRVPANGTYTSI